MKENKIFYQDNEITIFIVNKRKAPNVLVYIDTEDWDRVRKLHWNSWKNSIGLYYIYSQARNDKKIYKIMLYNFILNCKRSDHIDHDPLNNRKYNLRECTKQQNLQNRKFKKINCASKYKGVQFDKKYNKYKMRIQMNFDTEEEAAMAYNKCAKILYGEFACLNGI